ncbi:MAG: AsmA family protein, partial [Rhizobiales bacterium]|nr:AsmA family protein [Hyphomicrobiales bacterium]
VQVASQDASKLSAALGAGVAFNGEVALSGEFEGDKRRYRLSKIKMAMPGIKGSFDGALTPKDTTFSLTGAGRFEELSLSPVMGLLTLGPPIGGAPNSVFWADRPFRATALEQLSLDVRVSAENLILAPGVIASSASFNLRQGEGKLSLANGTGNLFGGSLQGSFLAESVTGGNLALQAKVDLNDANMADLLKDEAGQALVQGTISLEGNVEGQGRSPGGIVSVLTGKGEWSLGNSRLMGTNPGGFSKSIGGVEDAAKLEGLISANLHQGVWPYKPVRSEWAVQDGLLKLAPGKITSPVAAGSVGGLANLANGKLSADWNVRVSGVENAPEYKVKLEGPIGKLVRSHDTSSLRSFLVVRVLQESMKKLEELQREQERIFQERKKSQEPAAAEPNGAEEVPANKVDEAPNQTNEKKAEAGETSAEQSAQKDTPTPEASKQIDERAAAERRKKSEESKAAEELNAAEARKSQKAREREEARKQAEARKKEQAQKEAEARQAEQARKAAEELKKVEEREKATRLASEAASRAELERLAAEAAARKVAEREADEKKAAEEKAQKEAKRKAAIAEERRKAEKARAEERAAAEELRAAQEREGGDRKALGLQQLKESRRAKDDNR